MPTGYTSDLYEGIDQTFPEFALTCARTFGALILMRDDPLDAEIPDEFAPGDYYVKALDKTRSEYNRLITLSVEEAQAEADRLANEWIRARAEEEAKRLDRERRYGAMLAEVEAWTPPTSEHQGLKDFMVQQLTESIRFDCSTYERTSPERDGLKWREEAINKARKDIEYYATEHAKEVERAASRTAWVQSLRQSLQGAEV